MERCKHDAQATTCRLCYLEKNRNKNNIKTTPKIKVDKCIYLGKRARNSDGSIKTELCTTGCAKGTKLDVFECQVFGETTLSKCRNCSSKCTQVPKVSQSVQVPDYLKYLSDGNNPKIGIVIGSYGWPSLVELQIKIIRKVCGDIPILISDDCSDGCSLYPDEHSDYNRLKELTNKYYGVSFWPNAVRSGHCAGDLTVFVKGLTWAKQHNLEYLVKISRRFLCEVPYWIQYWTHRLIEDTNNISIQRRLDTVWQLHTQVAILKTNTWFSCIHDLMTPHLNPEITGKYVEHLIQEIIDKRFGGRYSPLGILSKEPTRKDPEVIWYQKNTLEDYIRCFNKYGLTPDKDFSALPSGYLPNFKIG